MMASPTHATGTSLIIAAITDVSSVDPGITVTWRALSSTICIFATQHWTGRFAWYCALGSVTAVCAASGLWNHAGACVVAATEPSCLFYVPNCSSQGAEPLVAARSAPAWRHNAYGAENGNTDLDDSACLSQKGGNTNLRTYDMWLYCDIDNARFH